MFGTALDAYPNLEWVVKMGESPTRKGRGAHSPRSSPRVMHAFRARSGARVTSLPCHYRHCCPGGYPRRMTSARLLALAQIHTNARNPCRPSAPDDDAFLLPERLLMAVDQYAAIGAE